MTKEQKDKIQELVEKVVQTEVIIRYNEERRNEAKINLENYLCKLMVDYPTPIKDDDIPF